MLRHFARGNDQWRVDRQRLDTIASQVLRDVPGTALAADQPFRLVDVAIDFAEDVPPLPHSAAQRIASIFKDHGAEAKISSIHVNAWFGDHDKLSSSLHLLRSVFGIDADADRHRIVFAGDSPNDAPMFAYFPNAVGVANVRQYQDLIATLPAYVTERAASDGFVELADHLIASRLLPKGVAGTDKVR
jgi:hydroxymethylpyrimidine pyrophosphatase-like HAD family hydrolase